MEPIPPPDGGIPITPPPEQPKAQETTGHPFVQRLTKEQEKIDAGFTSLYPKEEPYSESARRETEIETRVFHRQETDILDADRKPTGNKRVTIVSSRPCQLSENSNKFYYSFIDYESANPEKVKEGLLRILNGYGGMVIPESALFGRENNLVRNAQLANPGGVFGAIRSRIDRGSTGPASSPDEFGVVNLVDESEQIQGGFRTAFQKSIEQTKKKLEYARRQKEIDRQKEVKRQQEIAEDDARRKAEKEEKANIFQNVLTDSMSIFDEPAVVPVQIVEQTPPVEAPRALTEPSA